MGFSYHEKGYRPRPIALFIARVRAGPRQLENSADASRSIDRSVDLSIYKFYTRARENGLNGRNGSERNGSERNGTERKRNGRNGMKKITRLSIVKRNGTERERNGNAAFF